MTSKQFQSPEKIDEIVGTMESAVQSGKKVSIHCFHGSNRGSGLISVPRTYSRKIRNCRNSLLAIRMKRIKRLDGRYDRERLRSGQLHDDISQLEAICAMEAQQLTGGTKTVDGKNQSPAVDTPVDANAQSANSILSLSPCIRDTRFHQRSRFCLQGYSIESR